MHYRLGFVMEQTLGHATHQQNLARCVQRDPQVRAIWVPVPYHADDRWEKLPLIRRNWSLRASLRARRGAGSQPVDGLFYHTQVTALCSLGLMRRIATVISLDATPANMDSVGAGYNHKACSGGPLDRLKWRWNRAAFRAAEALTTWSRWARDSLEMDYGISADRVTVIPPGVDVAAWTPQPESGTAKKVRLLFVGGDFARKGGVILLEAFRSCLADRCELNIVTRERSVQSDGSVRVHHGLAANSAALCRLFAQADIFVLPTQGDCMPLAILEAMASGLPVIASDVGAIKEEVADGVSGVLVAPGNAHDLVRAVRALAEDAPRRRSMGKAGRERAEMLFCAERNYGQLIALMKHTVDRWRQRASCTAKGGGDQTAAFAR